MIRAPQKRIDPFLLPVLNRGDLILTGTPGGVGSIKEKDKVSVAIEGLGETNNKVILSTKNKV